MKMQSYTRRIWRTKVATEFHANAIAKQPKVIRYTYRIVGFMKFGRESDKEILRM